MTNRLIDAVIRSAKDTFADMLQIKINSETPVECPINANNGISSEICTIISFVGEVSGALMFKCSKKTAVVIASRMFDEPVKPDSDELKDAMGELLNIIIGSAKSYYSDQNTFSLSIPTTVVGQDFSLYIKANTGATAFYVPLKSGNAHMGIEVFTK